MTLVLGLDFGGTKLAAGLVDTASGTLLADARCPTPPGAEASLAAMLALADGLLAERQDSPVAVGVSFGGPVEADGRRVRLSMHIPGWEQQPLAERLEQRFGLPAAIANDGDAAALAEHRFGAGRGVRNLLYLTVSTGIGGGLVIDGRLYRGERAWAGEIGHMLLKPDGPPCPCGRNGCLEALASGLSVARAMRQGRPEQPAVTAQQVAEAAAAGDPLARAVWDEAMGWLGVGVASAANLLNPGRVVIGGGLARAGELLFAPVRQTLALRALDPALELAPAALGDAVGIYGGAAVAQG
ncbi:MAG: ROK family glucokinase [Roseiflexaceae bacterium]